ncbi:hypothetical protein MAR_013417 [Mya arenaria]|uniref:Inositol 1,4,5-trisphosphate/ryanodine receptor domain-containing protein n=1 Tax=Mya arenaria TaxID=6604 RepID=A0ABY7G3J3_MYAAR|nr:hypothetical protein MAR_013417 [Mya arenaria]
MADDTLCIGDSVCLYSAESYGFVFSTQTSSVHNEVAVGHKQNKSKPDIRDQNANAETEDNELEQKRQQGKKLLYGQIIQLKHKFTDKFIHVSTTVTSYTESNNMAVQVDDQIVFESVKSPGQYLHVSKSLLGGQSVYQKGFELNLSVQQSGFTVGDMVAFYHKEMEAYLVAEGLFDDVLTEDAHLRMRPVDQSNPKTLFPSSSAVTKYLCVQQGGKVTLTSDHMDPNTESDDIPEDSYCRIEHVVSGHWMHALTEDYKKAQEGSQTDSKSMGSLKWSNSQLRKIGVVEEKQYDDAFTLQAVEQPLEKIFNFMAGMGLEEIAEFMVVNGEPIKQRQKLMRNLRIVELLVSLLKST